MAVTKRWEEMNIVRKVELCHAIISNVVHIGRYYLHTIIDEYNDLTIAVLSRVDMFHAYILLNATLIRPFC